MVALLTAVHVLVALILIFAVLLQSARGTDLAGAFGGMGSQAAFGPRGTATFLSKATVVLAVVFMMTSVSLAILANRSAGGGGGSILSEEEGAPAQTGTTPATPTPATPSVQVSPGIQVTMPDAPAGPNAPAASAETAPSAPTAPAAQQPSAPAPNP